MKTAFFIASSLIIFGCGPMNEKARVGSDPCEIEFKFSGKNQNNTREIVRYDSFRHSASCDSYIGENVRRLHYKLSIKARPSVGRLGFVVIDQGRSASLGLYSLGEGNIDTDNLLPDEWVGPLDGVDNYYLVIGFPEGTEKSLYPTEVKLRITHQ